MLKYLLIGLLVWLVLIPALKRALGLGGASAPPPRAPGSAPQADPDSHVPQAPPAASAEPMVACAHCGVHLPETETHRDGAGRPYCSAEHARRGPRPA